MSPHPPQSHLSIMEFQEDPGALSGWGSQCLLLPLLMPLKVGSARGPESNASITKVCFERVCWGHSSPSEGSVNLPCSSSGSSSGLLGALR